MIQMNLLPAVKLEYIKAERSRRMVLSIATLVCAVAVGILVLLLFYNVLQRKHLSDLNKDIKSQTATLKGKKDIDKVLTVQNQLKSLTNLHAQKPAASRVFTYLNQVTPTTVDITDFKVDFTAQKMTVTGTADSLGSVNQYVDTLKFTTFTTDSQPKPAKAFKNIVLTSFGLTSNSSGGRPASYSIDLTYDPAIFDITQKVTLNVPNLTTTRSNSADLFRYIAPATSKGTN